MMKQTLALLSWGLICIPEEPEAFTFAKTEVGHPVDVKFQNSKSLSPFDLTHPVCRFLVR